MEAQALRAPGAASVGSSRTTTESARGIARATMRAAGGATVRHGATAGWEGAGAGPWGGLKPLTFAATGAVGAAGEAGEAVVDGTAAAASDHARGAVQGGGRCMTRTWIPGAGGAAEAAEAAACRGQAEEEMWRPIGTQWQLGGWTTRRRWVVRSKGAYDRADREWV